MPKSGKYTIGPAMREVHKLEMAVQHLGNLREKDLLRKVKHEAQHKFPGHEEDWAREVLDRYAAGQ
jgi:CHAD domain-containing protein